MKITELLDLKSIDLNPQVSSKEEAIDHMVDLLDQSGKLNNKEVYKESVLKREAQSTTGIGDGVAIPHGQSEGVQTAGLAAMVIKEGLDFQSLDGKPTYLFFMIGAPKDSGGAHLQALAQLSTLLMEEDFRNSLINASSKEEFLKLIDEKENKKEEVKDVIHPDVLAVTACPTGIAHTFMAAKALQQAGEKLHISIKVETNGQEGVKNELTQDDIDHCKCIIVAADKKVEMQRFEGKKLIQVPVRDGISKAEELVEKASKGEAEIYHYQEGKTKQGIVRTFYKHLMNGVSHMLPFVIGGGILIALAFLFDDYSIDPSNFGMNTPAAAFFKTAGGVAFNFMLPILAGFIAMSIADRPGLMVGFVGGSVASAGTTFASCFNSDITVISGGFLGALFAGFLAGYLVLALEKITEKMPSSMDGLRPMLIYPVAGLLLISVIMFAINPFFSWLNQLLADALNSLSGTNSILLGLIIGGMMSIDMGGPFNKAAYVFGTASLAYQTDAGYMIMAAVMVAGMVPPIAIAIASWVFKNKFTDNDRKTAPVNAIMGLCFISEAAIPYAAGDPLHVIPSCVIGSAVAGALSMAFKCTLMAPHGGIFVFPVVGHTLMYIVALLIGAIVGAIMLGLLRKPVESK